MASKKKQVKILIDAQLALAFKSVCAQSGVSMAGELARLMAGRVGASAASDSQPITLRIRTRRDRRRTMCRIVSAITSLRGAEEAYKENIPDNLMNGPAYENAEASIEAMDEAISLLAEAFG